MMTVSVVVDTCRMRLLYWPADRLVVILVKFRCFTFSRSVTIPSLRLSGRVTGRGKVIHPIL